MLFRDRQNAMNRCSVLKLALLNHHLLKPTPAVMLKVKGQLRNRIQLSSFTTIVKADDVNACDSKCVTITKVSVVVRLLFLYSFKITSELFIGLSTYTIAVIYIYIFTLCSRVNYGAYFPVQTFSLIFVNLNSYTLYQ